MRRLEHIIGRGGLRFQRVLLTKVRQVSHSDELVRVPVRYQGVRHKGAGEFDTYQRALCLGG